MHKHAPSNPPEGEEQTSPAHAQRAALHAQAVRAWFEDARGQFVFDYTHKHVSRRYHFLGVWSEISPLTNRLIPLLRKNTVIKSGAAEVSDASQNAPPATEDMEFALPGLPFQADSLDGVLMHHAPIAELDDATLQLTLEQVYQCLDARGRLIIIAFSRANIWHWPMRLLMRLRHRARCKNAVDYLPLGAQLGFADIRRIKRLMKHIGYDAIESKAVFSRPLLAPETLKKLSRLERLGRYFSTWVAPVILIRASKEVIPLTPIGRVKDKEIVLNNGAVGYTRASNVKEHVK